MTIQQATVLFLSGGSQVTQFVLTSLEGRREPLRLLATTSISDDAGLWKFDRVFKVPVSRRDPALFKQRIREIVAAEQVDLVVPCRDDDIELLGELAAEWPELHPKALCGPPDLARAMADKWSSFELCSRHGVPFAESCIAGCEESPQQFAVRVGYPLIAKPRDGFSSLGILLLENDDQLQRIAADTGYVIQEYLNDPEVYWSFKRAIEQAGVPLFYTLQGLKHSIQLMFAPDSTPGQVFAAYSEPAYTSRRVRPNSEPDTLALGRQCAELFARLGWRGPLNIQCQRDRHGRLKIHEFNGRYTGQSAGRWLLGYDEVALGLELFTGLKLAPSRWAARPAVRVVARLASRGADPEDIATLEAAGVWSRSPD